MGSDTDMNTAESKLIYQLQPSRPFDVVIPSGFEYRFCRGWLDGMSIKKSAIERFGYLGMLKNQLKLSTPRRLYCCILFDGKIVSDAWIMRSFCRHYHIEVEAAVIGPVWSHNDYRNRGLATALLKSAINSMGSSASTFYIDTSPGNESMRKVISHCGFVPCKTSS